MRRQARTETVCEDECDLNLCALLDGSERACRRAAAIQSLFATAKLNALDPASWLADTLDKLPTCRNSNIDSLLPFADSTLT